MRILSELLGAAVSCRFAGRCVPFPVALLAGASHFLSLCWQVRRLRLQVRGRAPSSLACLPRRGSNACAEQAARRGHSADQELRVKGDGVPPPRGQGATATTPPVRGAPGSGGPRLGSAGETPSLAPSQGEDRRGLPEDTGCERRVPTRGESTQAEGTCPGRQGGH